MNMNALERLGLEVVAFELLGSRSRAASLCSLLDANGKPITAEAIVNARQWRMSQTSQDNVDHRNVAKTRICLLREALEDIGLGNPIVTHGEGSYSLPDPGPVIERLKQEARA